MTEWWTSLDIYMKILWCIAIATSLTFVLQSILTFIGVDSGGDFDTDIDTNFDSALDSHPTFEGDSSMNLFTFRNLINFSSASAGRRFSCTESSRRRHWH